MAKSRWYELWDRRRVMGTFKIRKIGGYWVVLYINDSMMIAEGLQAFDTLAEAHAFIGSGGAAEATKRALEAA